MASERILELLRRPVDDDEYQEIRELWKTHSIAEDNRDLPGLISTLTEDCVYEVMGTGARWEGHEGAARFYTELLTAFPDIHFDLEFIVIGPQGVCEEARVTATHQARWLEHEPSGERLEWRNAIFFPWDPAAKKFRGETVYTDLSCSELAGGGVRRRPLAREISRALPDDVEEGIDDGRAELAAAPVDDLRECLRRACARRRTAAPSSSRPTRPPARRSRPASGISSPARPSG